MSEELYLGGKFPDNLGEFFSKANTGIGTHAGLYLSEGNKNTIIGKTVSTICVGFNESYLIEQKIQKEQEKFEKELLGEIQ